MKWRVNLISRVIINVVMNDLEFSKLYFSTNYHFQATVKPTSTAPLLAPAAPGPNQPQNQPLRPQISVVQGDGEEQCGRRTRLRQDKLKRDF